MKTLVGMLLSMLAATVALAQSGADYPARPVRIIVAFAPGGQTDTMARLTAAFMEKRFKQSFFVENRPGGQTLIGTDAVAKAAPDGYTLLVTASNIAGEQVVNKDWPLRWERDLTMISIFAGSGYALVVSNKLPVNNLKELVAYSKANPGKLNQAEAGSISPDMAILRYKLGMGPVESVLYKGGPLSVQAIAAGEVEMYGASVIDVAQLEKAGKLKILLYTERDRHPLAPHVPTPREVGMGLDDFEAGFWFALMGPAMLPADINTKLNAAARDLAKSPEFIDKVTSSGAQVYQLSTAESTAKAQAMVKRYQEAMAAGIKLR